MFIKSILIASFAAVGLAAPLVTRANPCFVTGKAALPAEVADGLSTLAKSITCNNKVQVTTGVPDVTSGGISFSSIDFQKSKSSPLGFALATFKTPADPKAADLNLLQNQLNVYLAVESGVRSQTSGSSILNKLKGPKFFLQFQIARANQALGKKVSAAGTVEHQLGKVLKNVPGATAAEKAQVQALAKVV
ncbi:hypothetical protein GALMADRAFT_253743 [Galerina marginata CBS 339.88]|uniref:DUF7143 domain-containing protein n=1 Tax=Galerina marginata (strain CBS 339.88) TaxID=685588 RepID=A0A067SKJ2_GALM3|nr:hypothetical protein GALMADRAFT_253743 [Galerina marginata CBS 339.88]